MHHIMIDPVGGGNNHGIEYNDRIEKNDVIKFSNLLCEKLEDKHQGMISMTRYNDMDITMRERVEIITFSNPDLVISIRRNTEDGLAYYATPNSIASNIMQILSLKIKDLYPNIIEKPYKSKILTIKSPVLTLFINNIYSNDENKKFDDNSKVLIDEITEVIYLIDHNSPETIKNIINGFKTNDRILTDDEGYFVIGPHPGYNEGIVMRTKSFNTAVRICNNYINLHVFMENDPNAKSLHKSNLKKIAPAKYIEPLVKYQDAYITSKTGTRSFQDKNLKSKTVTTYTYRKSIKILASKCDAKWVYVIDNQHGNGYIPRKCVSI